MGKKKRNLRKFRKICGKYREEMWEIKKRNLGEFSSNLCQGRLRARKRVIVILINNLAFASIY